MAVSPYREMPLEVIGGLDQFAILKAWSDANDELQAVKYRETQLRMMAFQRNVPDPKEGTNTLEIGSGFVLKAEYKYNYNLSKVLKNDAKEVIGVLDDSLDVYERETEDKSAAERLVKWSPEISVTEYKRMKDNAAFRHIAPFLTIKPGMPTLSIVAPGEPGNKR